MNILSFSRRICCFLAIASAGFGQQPGKAMHHLSLQVNNVATGGATPSRTIMNSIIRIFAVAFSLLAGSRPCAASRAPEGYEGVIMSISAKSVTVKNQESTRVFKIEKAGICGWPTKKKILDVFKTGDKVIVYYFGDPSSKAPTAALNIFYADEDKVRAFQKSEPTYNPPKQER